MLIKGCRFLFEPSSQLIFSEPKSAERVKGLNHASGGGRSSTTRLSFPRKATRTPPWVGRCTPGAGRRRCRRFWRCSARIWSQVGCKAAREQGHKMGGLASQFAQLVDFEQSRLTEKISRQVWVFKIK